MNIDLIAMFNNLAVSLLPVQKLISAVGYMLGIVLFVAALQKLRKASEKGGHQKPFAVFGYFFGATLLLFFPSMIRVLANSVFGSGNILQFSSFTTFSIYHAIYILITTVGIIWFLLGCYLVMLSSEHEKVGKKGFMYLFAGIFAINFESTVHYVNMASEKLTALTLG